MSGWLRGLLRRWLTAGLPATARQALRLQLALARGDQQPSTVDPPAGRRVLVVAPHADDETFGCGGTLALAAAAGCRVQVVVLTDGRKGYEPSELPAGDAERGAFEDALAARRLQEVEAACTHLGLLAPQCLGLPDGDLAGAGAAAVDQLARVLSTFAPEVVFSPFASDAHPDHIAATRLLTAAARRASLPAGTEVWAYETWTPLAANTFVDIGSAIGAKRAAIAAYASQTGVTDYSRAFEGLAAYRALGAGLSRSHVEAFHRETLAGYAGQVDAVRGGPRSLSDLGRR